MIPEFTLAHAALTEHRIREDALAAALDRPDRAYRDHRPARRGSVRGFVRTLRRLARADAP